MRFAVFDNKMELQEVFETEAEAIKYAEENRQYQPQFIFLLCLLKTVRD